MDAVGLGWIGGWGLTMGVWRNVKINGVFPLPKEKKEHFLLFLPGRSQLCYRLFLLQTLVCLLLLVFVSPEQIRPHGIYHYYICLVDLPIDLTSHTSRSRSAHSRHLLSPRRGAGGEGKKNIYIYFRLKWYVWIW